MYPAASEAAYNYSIFWSQRSRIYAEYWSDISRWKIENEYFLFRSPVPAAKQPQKQTSDYLSNQMDKLGRSRKEFPKDCNPEEYGIDKILSKFECDCVVAHQIVMHKKVVVSKKIAEPKKIAEAKKLFSPFKYRRYPPLQIQMPMSIPSHRTKLIL